MSSALVPLISRSVFSRQFKKVFIILICCLVVTLAAQANQKRHVSTRTRAKAKAATPAKTKAKAKAKASVSAKDGSTAEAGTKAKSKTKTKSKSTAVSSHLASRGKRTVARKSSSRTSTLRTASHTRSRTRLASSSIHLAALSKSKSHRSTLKTAVLEEDSDRADSIREETAGKETVAERASEIASTVESGAPEPQGRFQGVTRRPTKLDRMAPFRRCLWVTRWDFQSPEDLHKICYNAASARFTDIMFQVRGDGTVYYPSAIEPWAGGLSGGDVDGVGRDPGWDPLATAIREAHAYGLRLHAYMNVLPGWGHDSSPPHASHQLFREHPGWFMVDSHGRMMQPNGFYAFLDPALPQVRAYLARLFAEVAEKYPVDGIHLDYIRYPDEKGDFSYHPTAVARFKALCGFSPDASPEKWAEFRRAQVTATVEAISKAVRKVRPSIELSAAVVADQDRAANEAYQPGLEWVRRGLLDAIAPMAYCGKMERFDELCQPFRDPEIRKRVWLGIWADPNRNTILEPEIRRAAGMGFGAVAVFSYSELFPEHRPSTRAHGVYQAFVNSHRTMLSQAD